MSEKAPELTKQEKFAKNPDEFYHLGDLAIAVTQQNDNKERQVLVNSGSLMEMGGLIFLIQRHCNMMLDVMRLERQKESNIITKLSNKSGFNNFVKGKR